MCKARSLVTALRPRLVVLNVFQNEVLDGNLLVRVEDSMQNIDGRVNH